MGAELRVRDEREEGEALEAAFQGELRPEQKAAAEAMMRHDAGVLEAGTAFGKTVLAAWMVAARGRSALVIVNRVTLQRQWIARLAQFLGLRERDIGRIGGGARRRATGRIDVAILQSLLRRPDADQFTVEIQFVVVVRRDRKHQPLSPLRLKGTAHKHMPVFKGRVSLDRRRFVHLLVQRLERHATEEIGVTNPHGASPRNCCVHSFSNASYHSRFPPVNHCQQSNSVI